MKAVGITPVKWLLRTNYYRYFINNSLDLVCKHYIYSQNVYTRHWEIIAWIKLSSFDKLYHIWTTNNGEWYNKKVEHISDFTKQGLAIDQKILEEFEAYLTIHKLLNT